MATTSNQDKAFIADLISGTLLEQAIAWISRNLSPEDVFSESDLTTWAEDSGFTKSE